MVGIANEQLIGQQGGGRRVRFSAGVTEDLIDRDRLASLMEDRPLGLNDDPGVIGVPEFASDETGSIIRNNPRFLTTQDGTCSKRTNQPHRPMSIACVDHSYPFLLKARPGHELVDIFRRPAAPARATDLDQRAGCVLA